ncbi:MAG: AarF/ABC1/UbiB kinase family protein [Alphaproteobacteria bacterium]|nr:MAG: AarF/ABC1/UbiB kinase family protein [Alphaproteobacteria bacterium]
MSDKTITGKWNRLGTLGPSLGNLAMRAFLENYLGIPANHIHHAEAIKKALGSLKGPIMKIAQMLASIPGAVPDEYRDSFRELQTNAPAMSAYFALRRMTAELGRSPHDMFQSFSSEPFAAASLGQVHHAKHCDGTDLVCKIQYPDMHNTVCADIAHVHRFLSVYQGQTPALDVQNVVSELEQRLYEELDYDLEAKNTNLFARIFAAMLGGGMHVRVPRVYAEYSTKKLLTMMRCSGTPVYAVMDQSQEWRNVCAQTLFRAWYIPFYTCGVIHGDPHTGNYSVDLSTDTLNIYDFGCVRRFTPRFVMGVIRLYRALLNDDKAACAEAYEQWGFKGLSPAVIETLNLWSRYVYAPLLDDRVRPIDEEYTSTKGRTLAAAVFQELRAQGGVSPPHEFVFLDRATVGMGGVFMTLRASLNWHQEFETLIAGLDENIIQANQEKFGVWS